MSVRIRYTTGEVCPDDHVVRMEPPSLTGDCPTCGIVVVIAWPDPREDMSAVRKLLHALGHPRPEENDDV